MELFLLRYFDKHGGFKFSLQIESLRGEKGKTFPLKIWISWFFLTLLPIFRLLLILTPANIGVFSSFSMEPHRVLTSDFLNGFSIAFVSQRTKDSDALIEFSISLSHNIFFPFSSSSSSSSSFILKLIWKMKMFSFTSNFIC